MAATPVPAQALALCMVCTIHISDADPLSLLRRLSGSSAPTALNVLKMSSRCVKRSQAQTWLKFIFQTDSIPPWGLIDLV